MSFAPLNWLIHLLGWFASAIGSNKAAAVAILKTVGWSVVKHSYLCVIYVFLFAWRGGIWVEFKWKPLIVVYISSCVTLSDFIYVN